jgi:phosphinothricin acetyltransferase
MTRPQIRLAHDDDAAQIAAIYAPFCESTAVSFEEVAPSPAEIADRIRAVTVRFPWLVLDDGGAVAGYAYAGRHRERAAYRWSVDVTVYVGPEHQRLGVGRALYTTLLEILRLQGFFKAYAGISLPNSGSVALHEAIGFTLIGVYPGVGFKLGDWQDVAWYERALQPEQKNPPSPVSLSHVVGGPAWEYALSLGLRHYQGATGR